MAFVGDFKIHLSIAKKLEAIREKKQGEIKQLVQKLKTIEVCEKTTFAVIYRTVPGH